MRAGAGWSVVLCALGAALAGACGAPERPGDAGAFAETPPDAATAAGFSLRPGLGPDLQLRLGDALERLRVDLPETLWSPSPGFRFAPVLGDPGRALLRRDGYDAANASAKVRARWDVGPDVVEMQLTVTNRSDAPVQDLRGHVCLQLYEAPSFRHEGARQVFIFHDGEPLEFAELAKRDGYLASRVGVRDAGRAAAPAGARGAGPLFSRSGVLADDGVIVATSADGRWTLGTLWEGARGVFHNMLSGHQCIHSNPSFGDLAPGASATRRGWMVVVEGGPREAHRRLLALQAAARAPAEPLRPRP